MAHGPGGGLRYPFENVPGPGVLREVAPGIYWVRLPLPLRLNHVNVWLLAEPPAGGAAKAHGGSAAPADAEAERPAFTIVDAGLGDEVTRELWEAVLVEAARLVARSGRGGTDAGPAARPAAGRAPTALVQRIVLTHFHPDHSGAAGWLVEREHRHPGPEVLMSRGEHEQALASMRGESGSGAWSAVERLDPHGLPEATRQVLLGAERPFGALVPDVPDAFVPLAEGERIVLGGREWQVMTGYGHSPEHVCLYSEGAGEGAGILISGDMLLPHISSHVGSPVTWTRGNPVALFLESLRRLAELPASTLVLPGHGVPFFGVRPRVAALLEHHQERCARMLAALDAPQTAGDLLEVLFPRGLDPLQVILAMNETIAHLAYLEEQGHVRQERGADSKIRWLCTGTRATTQGV